MKNTPERQLANDEPVTINIALLAHIIADSDLQGRYGVQGYLFVNTIGYFKQYLRKYHTHNFELAKLVASVEKLHGYSRRMELMFNNKSKMPELIDFCSKISHEIQSLSADAEVLLPGGWRATSCGGHAMIYHFKRQANRDGHNVLRLYVYNAGAGVDYHEKISLPENERYYSTKVYEFPEPVDPQILTLLIKRLVLARMPHLRINEEVVDQDILYLRTLIYMESFLVDLTRYEPTLASELFDTTLTTTGQITGTCTQRSIHQMLKHHFKGLDDYRRFILDFKIDAIQDYLQTHTVDGHLYCHPQVAELIQFGIMNTIKICDIPNLFSHHQEKQAKLTILFGLQDQFNAQTAPDLSKAPVSIIGTNQHLKYSIIFPTNTPPLTVGTEHDFIEYPYKGDLPLNTLTINLLDELRQINRTCQSHQADPHWMIQQIERVVLALPMPEKLDKPDSIYASYIPTEAAYVELREELYLLNDLYVTCIDKVVAQNQMVTQTITRMNILMLQDHIHRLYCNAFTKPKLSLLFSQYLAAFFSGYKHSPYYATHHIAYDERFLALSQLYGNPPENNVREEQWVDYYNQLLELCPAQKKALNTKYNDLLASKVLSAPQDQALKAKNVCLLYVLLDEFSNDQQIKETSFLNEVFWTPLVDVLKEQFRLEMNILQTISSIMKEKDYKQLPSISMRQKYQSDDYEVTVIFPIHDYIRSNPVSLNCIENQYHLTESAQKNTFGDDTLQQTLCCARYERPQKKPSNMIQLLQHGGEAGRAIQKSDFFIRDLYHLRSAPLYQIQLTCDYFAAARHLLKDMNTQRYVEGNVFEPGLLRDVLRHDDHFIPRFEMFIKDGLKSLTKANQSLEQEALFFLHMNILVARYAYEFQPSHYALYLQESARRIHDLILTNRDPEILASLHQYQFIALMAYVDQNALLSDEQVKHALFSYFYLQAKQNSERPNDQETQYELQRLFRRFRSVIHQNQHLITDALVHQAIGLIDSSFAELSLSEGYPRWRMKSTYGAYDIDVASGSIYLNQKKLTPIPLSLRRHPLLTSLGLELASSCLLSPDGNVMEFNVSSGNIRLIKKANNTFEVQKTHVLQDGQIVWHQLLPLNKQQRHIWSLEQKALTLMLPAILQDGSMMLWQADKKFQSGLLTQGDEILYVAEQDASLGLLLKNKHGKRVHQPLATLFEDAHFALSFKDGKNDQVDFKRYGIVLHRQDTNYVLAERPTMVLQNNNTLPNLPAVACLAFQERQIEQGQEKIRDYFIVPVQPFYVSKDTPSNGEYYPFKHDIGHVIPKTLMDKKWSVNEIPEEKRPLWHYEQTAKSIQFAIVNGEVRPEKAADGLYLCYLYLASMRPDLAWAVLGDVQRRFSLEGTYEELTYLHWIVDGLPVLLSDGDRDATRQMPRYGACQLKAISLLTQFLDRDKKPTFPAADTYDESTANGQYDALCLEAVTSFYKTLTSTIYSRLNTYFTIARHLTRPCFLDEAALQSLMNYYTGHSHNVNGALGYQKRLANLASLSRELRLLEASIESLKENPRPAQFMSLDLNAAERRFNEIKKEVAAQKDIMKHTTVIEKQPIDLSLPKNVHIDESRFTPAIKEFYILANSNGKYTLGWKNNLTNNVLDDGSIKLPFGPETSELHFFEFFPTYLKIARNPIHPLYKALKSACITLLIAHRHVPLKKQPNNLLLLVSLLYRACCFNNNAVSITHLIDELKSPQCEESLEPIEIYQPVDQFKTLLETSQSIFDTLLKQMPSVQSRLPVPDVYIEETSLIDGLSSDVPSLEPFKVAYRHIENEYDAALQTILERLPDHQSLEALRAAEQEAGTLQLECLTRCNGMAQQLKSWITPLNEALTKTLTSEEATLDQKWQETFAFALQKPDDAAEEQRLEIARRTLQLPQLTEKELLNLYFRANLQMYQEQTGFSVAQVEALHAQLHHYAIQKLHVQHIRRAKQALEKTQASPSDVQYQVLASTLMSRNLQQAQRDPAALRFELEEDKLLRPRQLEAIEHLFGTPKDDPHHFNQWVEKIIMGGGKSKVLLPLLAYHKATGLNLAVIEVPRALLATNYTDLNATSQKLFDQSAHIFEFDRDSDCSSLRLEAIYQQLQNVMTRRDYVITTGEAIQSFRLKYKELLLSKPLVKDGANATISDEKSLKEWRAQITLASKLMRFFKERADVIIDEVHEGLLFKRKLNYAFGEPSPIVPEVVRHNIELYRFTDTLLPAIATSATYEDEAQRIQSNEKIRSNGFAQIKDKLAHNLIYDENSPLKNYVDQLCYTDHTKRDSLVRYLKDESPSDVLRQCADIAVLDAFAFYKAQQNVLNLTLSKRYKENYGPSQNRHSSELERALAIPYIGNGRSNERSRYSNQLELMNYTIQSLRLTGLSQGMLKEVIQNWLNEARHELLKSKTALSLAQTKIASIINKAYLNDLNLSFENLDIENDALMTQLHQHLRYHSGLIEFVLEAQVLPQITQEKYVLSSNAFNHADCYRSRQGVSGTLSYYNTLHADLNFNPKTSLGTDGFIQALLREKKTPVKQLPFTHLSAYLKTILDEGDATPRIRALIDISATFTGYTNLEVAQELAKYYKTTAIPTKYILYFDEENRLCAFSCTNPTARPVVLNTSDPNEITQKLGGCLPEERFTYYDQLHRIGVDINQSLTSIGVALIDERTQLQDFLQGVMRMRGLEVGQGIKIFAQCAGTLEQHFERMIANEERQLKQDNFDAALEKIDSLFEDDLFKRILACESPDEQARLAEAFKLYFIETHQLNLFKQYGAVSSDQRPNNILPIYAATALKAWERLLSQQQFILKAEEVVVMEQKLQIIIDKALPQCPESVKWQDSPGSQDQEYEKEQQQEKEQEQQREQQQEKENEFYNDTLNASYERDWTSSLFDSFNTCYSGSTTIRAPFPSNDTIGLEPLTKHLPKDLIDFSAHITMTENYKNVYYSQPKVIGYYLKPNHLAVFRRDQYGTLLAYLVTNKEAEQIGRLLRAKPTDNMWIASINSDTILDGHLSEENAADEKYHVLMEQLRYFAGHLALLANQTEQPLRWIMKNPESKLDFFKEHLMPFRSTSNEDFCLLKATTSASNEGYDYIQAHAFDDLRQFDWENKYPDLSKQSIRAIQTLADIYHKINSDVATYIPDRAITEYTKACTLLSSSATALSYVEQHLNTRRVLDLFRWLATAEIATNVPPALRLLFREEYAQIAQTCSREKNLIQLNILMRCFKSPAFREELFTRPEILNIQLVRDLKMSFPVNADSLLIAFLKSSMVTQNAFAYILMHEHTPQSIAELMQHSLFTQHSYTNPQIENLIQYMDLDEQKALLNLKSPSRLLILGHILSRMTAPDQDLLNTLKRELTSSMSVRVSVSVSLNLFKQFTTIPSTDLEWVCVLLNKAKQENQKTYYDAFVAGVILNEEQWCAVIQRTANSFADVEFLAKRLKDPLNAIHLLSTLQLNPFLSPADKTKALLTFCSFKQDLAWLTSALDLSSQNQTVIMRIIAQADIKHICALIKERALLRNAEAISTLIKRFHSDPSVIEQASILEQFKDQPDKLEVMITQTILVLGKDLSVTEARDLIQHIILFEKEFYVEKIRPLIQTLLSNDTLDHDVKDELNRGLFSLEQTEIHDEKIESPVASIPTNDLVDDVIHEDPLTPDHMNVMTVTTETHTETDDEEIQEYDFSDEALLKELDSSSLTHVTSLPENHEEPTTSDYANIIQKSPEESIPEQALPHDDRPMSQPGNHVPSINSTQKIQLEMHISTLLMHLKTLENQYPELIPLIQEFELEQVLLLSDVLPYEQYKQNCMDILQNHETQLEPLKMNKLSLFEHIKETVRLLFHVLDCIVSFITFSKTTMADTYTPGAQTLIGRKHFFEPVDTKSSLAHAINRFHEQIDKIEPDPRLTPK